MPTGECTAEEFQCQDGSCIQGSWRCDVIIDCLPDGEDEQGCGTKSIWFLFCFCNYLGSGLDLLLKGDSEFKMKININ